MIVILIVIYLIIAKFNFLGLLVTCILVAIHCRFVSRLLFYWYTDLFLNNLCNKDINPPFIIRIANTVSVFLFAL